jgi:hypothetical protein
MGGASMTGERHTEADYERESRRGHESDGGLTL